MAALSILTYMFVLWCIAECAPAQSENTQNLLHDALKDVLGPLRATVQRSNQMLATLRRRCSDRTACEFPFPATELHEVAFKNGEICVEASPSSMSPFIAELAQYFGGKQMHLQSSLVQIGPTSDWIAGPKLNVAKNKNISDLCRWNDPSSAANQANNHAVFLFPWETNNNFHALQDNILTILSTVILHYITAPAASLQSAPRYTVYVFNRVGRGGMGSTALLYDLLPVIFGEQYVLPARRLLRGGPHCVKHVSWGPAVKPMYRDSLHDLRRAVYDVLQHISRAYHSKHSTTPNTLALPQPVETKGVMQNVLAGEPLKRQLKAIIVTRAGTRDKSRRLNPATELLLEAQLQRAGFATEICCDFKEVNTVALLIEKFIDVDICVGIHGAGLSNCIFGRRGMTIIELQTHHGYGVMSFPKLAHMSGGDYVFYDLRTVDKSRLSDAGIHVPVNVVEQVVALAVKVYSFRNGLTIVRPPAPILSIFGSAKPTARVVSAGRIDAEVFHTISNSTNFVVVEPRTGSYYIQLGPQHTAQDKLRYQSILNNMLGVDFREQSMQSWTKEDPLVASPIVNVRSKKVINNELATIRRNNETYWILFNPSTALYTMDSILGPPVTDSYASCIALPYYQFRQLTLLPGDTSRIECEQSIQLRRKRSGTNDAKLLTDFIK